MTEKELRNKAKKIGFTIRKGLKHNFCMEGYQVDTWKETGFMIYDEYGNMVDGVCGCYDYALTLEDVEKILRNEYKDLGLKF